MLSRNINWSIPREHKLVAILFERIVRGSRKQLRHVPMMYRLTTSIRDASLAKDLCRIGDHARGMSELSAIKAAKLRKVIKEIATDIPRRLTQNKAADIITQHVKEHCDCLPLSSFDKFNKELKSTFQKDAGAKFIE